MRCSHDFVKWMLEPEGEGNGAPAKSIYSFVTDTSIPASWTYLDREDMADMLQQPWLIFLNVGEIGVANSEPLHPQSGYFRAGDVQAFAEWMLRRGIMNEQEAGCMVAKYTLELMEDRT